MNKYKFKVIAAIFSSVLISGCATQGGTDQLMGAGTGAVIGAAAGCGLGFIIGGNVADCIKGGVPGAVTGAVMGWGAVKLSQYQDEQVRTAKADQSMYPLIKPVNSPQVKIRKGTSTPNIVKPGGEVRLATDYSVTLPKNMQSSPVKESWMLKKDGDVKADLTGQDNLRSSGGWAADATIPIPKDAALGTYVIDHKIQAGDSYDTDESTFVVSR